MSSKGTTHAGTRGGASPQPPASIIAPAECEAESAWAASLHPNITVRQAQHSTATTKLPEEAAAADNTTAADNIATADRTELPAQNAAPPSPTCSTDTVPIAELEAAAINAGNADNAAPESAPTALKAAAAANIAGVENAAPESAPAAALKAAPEAIVHTSTTAKTTAPEAEAAGPSSKPTPEQQQHSTHMEGNDPFSAPAQGVCCVY